MNSFCQPSISVIIPVYNGGENFKRCLSSLAIWGTPPKEVIVVADGDTDGSWQVAEEYGARIFRFPSPGGPARARNQGARLATGDLLFFIDADVTIAPDAFEHISHAFQNDPGLAAVFGSYDDEPAESNFLSQYKNLFHHYIHQSALEEASTFWSACGAIRREVLMAMGGFDEKYRCPSIEDIELGYRLKRAGYRIRLLKELKVKHLKRWKILSLLKADFFYRALPWTSLILKEGKLLNDLNLKISNRVSVALICMVSLTLLGTLWNLLFLVLGFFLLLLVLGINFDLYRFFKKKRGLGFVLKTIPWHWFYFFYSGLAFALAYSHYQIKRLGKVLILN